jgi:Holliday junction resolvase-like predicted endonuclease
MARVSPRRQGDLGELSAMEWLGSQGYGVFIPVGHSPDYDLIADDGAMTYRVQVKTSTLYARHRWHIAVCTRGGNRSWSGTVKLFRASRCDRLFVLVGDGRRWFIPAEAVAGGSQVLLGGPKYAEFEVERGRPLPGDGPAPLCSAAPRRGSRAVKGDAL